MLIEFSKTWSETLTSGKKMHRINAFKLSWYNDTVAFHLIEPGWLEYPHSFSKIDIFASYRSTPENLNPVYLNFRTRSLLHSVFLKCKLLVFVEQTIDDRQIFVIKANFLHLYWMMKDNFCSKRRNWQRKYDYNWRYFNYSLFWIVSSRPYVKNASQ